MLTYKKSWRLTLKKNDRVQVANADNDIVAEPPFEEADKKGNIRYVVKLKTAGVVPVKRIRSRRSAPIFRNGDTVSTTRSIVTRKKTPRGLLTLIPGTEWKVVSVTEPVPPSKAQPVYRLKCSEFETEQPEGVLRPMRRERK